ncbi:MAG: hypothetical protein ACE5F2_02030 [Candidatus Paceibacteria bacterium]
MGILIGFALVATGAMSAQASSIDDIVYPVVELGGCENKTECKSYCDDINHMDECIAFAERHNLMSDREVRDAREFAKRGIRRGPGGCTTHDQCENYCEDVNNIEECLAFAEKHDMIPREELKEARQVAKALREGAELPGGCTSKQSCDAYCQDGAHIEECIAFAEKAGFMDEKELEEVRRILPLMKSGQMPGGCTSQRQCEAYCEDDANIIECVAFAEKAGFMSPQEAEMARKTGGRGPGGCRRDECEAYCEKPENQEACFAFAKEHNLIPEEDLARIKEGSQRIREGLKHAGPEVLSCLKRELGSNIIGEIESGRFSPTPKSGEVIKGCFEQHMERPNFPPEVEQCIKQVYGEDGIDRVMKGEIDQSEIERGIGPCVSEIMREKFGEDSFGRDDFEEEHGDDFGRRTFEGEHGGIGGEHDNVDDIKRRIDEERLRVEDRLRSEFQGSNDGQIDDSAQRIFEEEKQRIIEQETERRIREETILRQKEAEGNRLRELEKLRQFDSLQ